MSLGLVDSYSLAVLDRFTGGVLDLGGTARVESVNFGRRFGPSDGSIAFAPARMPDLKRLAAHPRRHVLAIWRDSETPAWYGPCTEVTETDEAVLVRGVDLLAWLDWRTLPALDRPIIGDLSDVARHILTTTYDNAVDPIASTRLIEKTNIETTTVRWTGNRPYAASELRRLTSASMNFTAAGHQIFGWANESDREISARVSPEQMGVIPSVTASATNSATVVVARSGALVEQWPPPGVVDASDGLVEILVEARGIRDPGLLRNHARAQWEQRRWPTIALGLDNGSLPPTFPLSFDQLVPGVRIGAVSESNRNLEASGVFELSRLDVVLGTTAGEIPRDAATGRFVVAGASAFETITPSWEPVAGKVTI